DPPLPANPALTPATPHTDGATRNAQLAAVSAVAAFTAQSPTPPSAAAALTEPPPRFPNLVSRLEAVERGTYDELTAYFLSFVSTWSYTDPKSFADVLRPFGWD